MSNCTTVPANVAQARISKPLSLIPPPAVEYPVMKSNTTSAAMMITFQTMGAMAGTEKWS